MIGCNKKKMFGVNDNIILFSSTLVLRLLKMRFNVFKVFDKKGLRALM